MASAVRRPTGRRVFVLAVLCLRCRAGGARVIPLPGVSMEAGRRKEEGRAEEEERKTK